MANIKLKNARYSSVYMDDARLRALKALSTKTHIPQQELFRMGIDLVLKKFAKKAGAQ